MFKKCLENKSCEKRTTCSQKRTDDDDENLLNNSASTDDNAGFDIKTSNLCGSRL